MLSDSGARVLVTGHEASAALEVPAEVRVLNLGQEAERLERMSGANLLAGAGPRSGLRNLHVRLHGTTEGGRGASRGAGQLPVVDEA